MLTLLIVCFGSFVEAELHQDDYSEDVNLPALLVLHSREQTGPARVHIASSRSRLSVPRAATRSSSKLTNKFRKYEELGRAVFPMHTCDWLAAMFSSVTWRDRETRGRWDTSASLREPGSHGASVSVLNPARSKERERGENSSLLFVTLS